MSYVEHSHGRHNWSRCLKCDDCDVCEQDYGGHVYVCEAIGCDAAACEDCVDKCDFSVNKEDGMSYCIDHADLARTPWHCPGCSCHKQG